MTASVQLSSRRDPAPTLTPEDLDALRRNATTSRVVHDARADAGLEQPIDVHGDDASVSETKHESSWGAAFDMVGQLTDAAEGAEMIETGVVASVAGPILALGLGLHELAEWNERGEALSLATGRDQMHHAVLDALDLPKGYADAAVARHSNPTLDAGRSGYARVTRRSSPTTGARRCCSSTATRACSPRSGCSTTRESPGAPDAKAFLAAHPDVGRRATRPMRWRSTTASTRSSGLHAHAPDDQLADAVDRLSACARRCTRRSTFRCTREPLPRGGPRDAHRAGTGARARLAPPEPPTQLAPDRVLRRVARPAHVRRRRDSPPPNFSSASSPARSSSRWSCSAGKTPAACSGRRRSLRSRPAACSSRLRRRG